MISSASLYIKADDEKVWQRYQSGAANLIGDAGFDLYVPEAVTFAPRQSRRVSMGISCVMRIHTESFSLIEWMRAAFIWFVINIVGILVAVSPRFLAWMPKTPEPAEDPITSFLIYPRSSISNGPLRLANSVGVVDSGYRGLILAALDNTSDQPYTLEAGTRIVQLCAPGLLPIRTITRVESFQTTERGSRGFGSTN